MAKADLISDLKGALAMLGQAQERLKPETETWKKLGRLYEDLDAELGWVKDREFNDSEVIG